MAIRNLKAEEIEVRTGALTEQGATLLLYKNARVDQTILDETFGTAGWQRTHERIGTVMFCTVSIWDPEKGMWIQKQDAGAESEYEKEKGAASDSFKRACVNLGIGRELYSAPFIFVPASKLQIKEVKGKRQVKDRFTVSSIHVSEDKEIISLTIINQRGETVFWFRKGCPGGQKPYLTEEEKRELFRELERTGVKIQTVLSRYGIATLEEMERDTFRKALQGLKKSKAA